MSIISGRTDEEVERERDGIAHSALLNFAHRNRDSLEDIIHRESNGTFDKNQIAKDLHDCQVAREKRERDIEIRKRRDRGGLIVLAILVLIGMLIAVVAGETKERRLKNAEATVSEIKP